MLQTHADDGVKTSIDLLIQAENRLVKLVVNIADEALVKELASVLSDLAVVRMQIELPRPSDKRTSARIHERGLVCVERGHGQRLDAALHDISAGGALIETDDPIPEGENCTIQIPGIEHSVKAIVRSTRRGLTHLVFDGIQPSELIILVKHIERHFTRY